MIRRFGLAIQVACRLFLIIANDKAGAVAPTGNAFVTQMARGHTSRECGREALDAHSPPAVKVAHLAAGGLFWTLNGYK